MSDALKRVTDIRPNLGCDPEFFFKSKEGIVGSETIIPEKGFSYGASKFVIDGVQAELQPTPSTCRALLANNISACFRQLQAELNKRGDGVVADFSRTVEISKENLNKLSDKSKKFGCAPSLNIYQPSKSAIKLDEVDPEKYRIRAAGGHIHIGKNEYEPGLNRALTTDHKRTVTMLDILCGNTAVLIDRDEANIERRKLYGRAGEFRQPPHGLEYRTLSNFWLTSYPLMSFAFGMARLAVQLMADKNHEEYYEAFTSKVKSRRVHNAINKNNFKLAMHNFEAIQPLILEVCKYGDDTYPIHKNNIKEFHYFVKIVRKKGMNFWFPQDPMQHWAKIGDAHTMGFSDYLQRTVRKEMNKLIKSKTSVK